MGQCPGPSPNPSLYRRQIGYIKKILGGQVVTLTKLLNRQMKQASKQQNYELALTLRNRLFSFNYIISGWSQLSHLYQSANLHDDLVSRALEELVTVLSPHFALQSITKIEGYDISNLGSKYFSGSQVVWENGSMDSSQYRHYKISTKVAPDDQFMIREVLYRRLKYTAWPLPDLILVDGGKPQVSAALQALELASLSIPLVGLAKKEEIIVIKTTSGFQEIMLPPQSQALRLLQTVRNEAHRFANRYRRLQSAKLVK